MNSFGIQRLEDGLEGFHNLDLQTSRYGIPDTMLYGFQNVKGKTELSHPLELSEKNWQENQKKMDFNMLRKIQGVHAPLKLQMERKIATKVGHLPCLPRSNLMLDILTGKEDTIEFEDILNYSAECEGIGNPHIMMEKQLNIL